MDAKIKNLKQQIQSYLSPAEDQEFNRVLELSMGHKDQQKIVDLLELMMEWQMDGASLCAAIAYVLCEADWTTKQLEQHHLSEPMVAMCKEVQRLNAYFTEDTQVHAALQKGYIAAYTHLPTLIVALAVHLINLPAIDHMQDDERRHWAQRNLDVYGHLFCLLGLKSYANLIMDISLRILDKPLYQRLEKRIDAYYKRWRPLFQRIGKRLKTFVTDIDLEVVRPQEVNPASLYMPLRTMLPIIDSHLVIDVIVQDIDDSYAFLQLVHAFAAGVPQVEDRLRNSQLNGERSLKTTFVDRETKQHLTFNIRTKRIDRINNYGWVAANLNQEVVKGAMWVKWRQLDPVQRHYVTVFSPDGRLHLLRPGATVLDFAFKIHSDLGCYARTFWVNGHRAPLHRELKTFDLIYVEFTPSAPAVHATWLEKAKTKTARQRIRRALDNRSARQFNRVLERECAIYRLTIDADELFEDLTRLAKIYGLPTAETLLNRIEQGHYAPDRVVNQLIDAKLMQHITLQSGKRWPLDRMQIARTWMQYAGAEKWSRHKRVMPGVPIVARRVERKGKPWLIIYREDDENAPGAQEAIPLAWKSYTQQNIFEVKLHLRSDQSDALSLLSQLKQSLPDAELLAFNRQTYNHAVQLTCTLRFNHQKAVVAALDAFKEQNVITDYTLWHVLPGDKLRYIDDTDSRIENPYSLTHVGRSTMFFGRRREIDHIMDNLKKDNTFIVLYGEKRIGKTSLLHYLAENDLKEGGVWLPVIFDTLSVANFNTERFLTGLVNATLRVVKKHITLNELRQLRDDTPKFDDDPFVGFGDWIRRLERHLHGLRLLFLIDEFTRVEDAFDRKRIDAAFFGGMQWLAEHQQVPLVICVHKHIYRNGLSSWNFLQHGIPADLRSLDQIAARRLIREPLSRHYLLEDGLVDRILYLTAGHPYFIQGLCMELLNYKEQNPHGKITQHELERAQGRMLTKGDHFFSHYYGGPDDFMTDVLKSIAYSRASHETAVSREIINQTMQNVWNQTDTKKIAYSINELIRRGAVEGMFGPAQNTYRITIPLLELWLKQLTHPLISKELREQT